MNKFPSQILGISFIFLGVILLLSFFSYTPRDIQWLSSPYNVPPHNLIGVVGSFLGFLFFSFFGKAAYFLPFFSLLKGFSFFGLIQFHGLSQRKSVNVASFFVFLFSFSPLLSVFYADSALMHEAGGFIGFLLGRFLRTYLGFWGASISLTIISGVTAMLLFGYFFKDFFYFLSRAGRSAATVCLEFIRQKIVAWKERRRRLPTAKKERSPQIKIYTPKRASPPAAAPETEETEIDQEEEIEEEPAMTVPASLRKKTRKKAEQPQENEVPEFDPASYRLPDITLIKCPPVQDTASAKGDIKAKIIELEGTLASFGVSAKVVSVQKGPVVTMFELEPSTGVKIQKITALADDIALSLKSSNVRIVAPIPGRGTVGVEVPNRKKQFVSLREVMEEDAFTRHPSLLALSIGKDVKGDPIVVDLKEMPHLLIAGATGSGKTVCVNSIIASVLFKAKPDQVKFILVDPKMVELAPYSGIPHLITPIISEHKKVFASLNWAVQEMERRYRLLADDGARNIDGYNKKEFRLPYIVIVVDELADLMAVARDNIELAIQRLAQLSRAVGIHLILATQRPSVDVITGVIKANFPSRISFKVSSKVDSRTVLDQMGAEKLLGKGDLLIVSPGKTHLIRAQGCFIDDDDIDTLTDFIRQQGGPRFEEKIAVAQEKAHSALGEDDLLPDAIKIVLTTRQASASLLQRRLRVGYTRAARLLDLMENEGIVGPFCGSKAREILVDPDAYLVENELV